MPPAAAGVAEITTSPVEELEVIALWCTLTFRLWQYGNCRLVTPLVWQEPGSAFTAPPPRYPGGNSPCPTLMPPESVPLLMFTLLVANLRPLPHTSPMST